MNIIRMVSLRYAATPLMLVLAMLGATQAGSLQSNVVFKDSTPLASAQEILRREYTPITVAGFNALQGIPLDPAKESFTLYVPVKKPVNGYGLLVFVPPWDNAKLPSGWSDVLDEDGVIFVSAGNSGNDATVRTRRMPLAVIAAANVMRQYSVDPSRVFVAGFSGGARVALRLALAYPDVFRGAILNSGSDPIGTTEIPLPPADLFLRFQESSRIIYVTGNLDQVPYARDGASMRSLQDFCVSHVNKVTMWGKAHDAADGSTFSEALDALLAPEVDNSDGMADCRAKLDADVQTQLKQVETLIASGDKADARKLLTEIDAKYGGLATPEGLTLDAKLR